MDSGTEELNDELLGVCKELLDFIKDFDFGGDWYQDNYSVIVNAKAVIVKAESM